MISTPKAGYKTTEFWMPVIKLGISLLVTLGILSATDDESMFLAKLIAIVIVAVVTLITTSRELIEYIKGRSLLKVNAISDDGTISTQLAETGSNG